jgi:Fungal chitosanase of glycosyl hydrolase group 75
VKGPKTHAFLSLSLMAAMVAAGCSKQPRETKQTPRPEKETVLPRKNYDTARLFSGLALKTSVTCAQGTLTSLGTIPETNSYEADITLHVRWPSAATNSQEILAATPELGTLLPGLPLLLEGAVPSPDFGSLLERKERSLRANLAQLQKLPYRDSLFDCQTILNLRHPENGRRVLLVQAIMNVNTDGSDGDRNLAIDRLSATFQPQTNYRWPKSGTHPNPCLRETESRLALLGAELGNGSLTPENKASLTKELEYLKATAEELRRWDFLVGTADPFIVLPSFMVGKSHGQPGIGDYAVVIAHGKLYPAILGDMGPGSKIGEASLRLCRAIDPASGADKRPVSRPEVAYLVFPGTAEKPFAAPDYANWASRCRDLWKELGGSETAPWHEWISLEKPWPTPTPSPSPSPSPSAFPETSPAAGTNPAKPDPTITPFQSNQPSTSTLSTPATNR